MTSAFRLFKKLPAIAFLLTILGLSAVVIVGWGVTRHDTTRAPHDSPSLLTTTSATWSEGYSPTSESLAWDVLCAITIPTEQSSSNSLLKTRFRLAGTFFTISPSGNEKRNAIVADSQKREQVIVGEGEAVDSAVVETIFLDHIIMRQGQIREEIWLSLLTSPQGSSADKNKGEVNIRDGNSSSNRFGIKVSENNWLMNKTSLMSYYRELMDDPSRMVQVFDSMEPVYAQEGRSIRGYKLSVKGEADFFNNVGLEQGDIVRRVNGMEMSNRRRAEYLIGEFANDRANAFVLDIERHGQPSKFIYQIK